jgi:hypothetical protein
VVCRPCCTPLKVSAVTKTFKKQWLVLPVYGEWLASSSLRDYFIDHDVGMRAIRKAKVHRQWISAELSSDAIDTCLAWVRKSRVPWSNLVLLATSLAQLVSVMASAWARLECHIPCSRATLLQTKLRQPVVATGWMAWSWYRDVIKICRVC